MKATPESPSDTTPQRVYLKPSPIRADGGEKVGKVPASISRADLQALEHPESPIKAIRAKCLDCSAGDMSEVRKCVAFNCALWPFRMGVNPFHAKAANRGAAT